MRTERGSVLLHVMVTGVLIALIAGSLLRMSLLRYSMGGRGAKVLQEKRDDQGALAGLLAVWNNANKNCPAALPAGYVYTFNAGAGSCNCVMTTGAAATLQTVTARKCTGVNVPFAGCPGANSCQLVIASPDIQ